MAYTISKGLAFIITLYNSYIVIYTSFMEMNQIAYLNLRYNEYTLHQKN